MKKLKFIFFLILVNGITGGIVYQQVQPSDVKLENANSEESWQIRSIPKDESQEAFIKLRKLKPWEKQDKTTTNAQGMSSEGTGETLVLSQQLKEKFVGIIQQGEHRYILLLEDKNKVSQYPLKKELPNGATLVGIYDDKIEIAQEDEIITLPLYNQSAPGAQ